MRNGRTPRGWLAMTVGLPVVYPMSDCSIEGTTRGRAHPLAPAAAAPRAENAQREFSATTRERRAPGLHARPKPVSVRCADVSWGGVRSSLLTHEEARPSAEGATPPR